MRTTILFFILLGSLAIYGQSTPQQQRSQHLTQLQQASVSNNAREHLAKGNAQIVSGATQSTTQSLTAQQQFVLGVKGLNVQAPVVQNNGQGGGDPRNLPLSKNGKLLSVDGFEVDFQVPNNPDVSSICFTPRPYVNGQTKDASCPFVVPCDNAANRDVALTSLKYFQLEWHVMQSTTGGASSNIDQARIDDLMTELNADYAAHNMVFCANPANFYVDDVNYTHDENTEEVSLKTTYNVNPAQVINIYVVGSMGPGGYARFPYDPMGGTSTTGGIVLNRGNCSVGTHTLAHEMGHVFGLEHTFSGVDERSSCSSCYEKVRNINGSSNTTGISTPIGGPYVSEGDREGDWCSDTNPHDTYSYNCSTSSNANGSCDAFPWNNAPVSNHMSYSFCSSQFTDQQSRRMHCMVNTYLGSWTSYGGGICGTLPPNADFTGTPLYGTAPLTVTFTDASSPTSIITGWSWNFDNQGLGGVSPATASTQGPHTVTYSNPGVYEVTLTVTSANGNDTETKTAYVEVITPPNTCDTLYTQWLTPTPTLSSYSFGAGDYVTGVPSPTIMSNPTDLASFSEMYPSAGVGTTVGGMYIIFGDLIDADGDLLCQINVWDDNGGEPDWLAVPTNAGYLGGSNILQPANFLPQDGNLYQLWIPFDNPVSIPGTSFHVSLDILAGDASDQFLLGSSADGQGEGDNSNFCWSTSFGTTLSYQNDIGLDFDLAMYPMLGPYTPLSVIEEISYISVCDTVYASIRDTLMYTPPSDMASIEYQFSDGQTFTFSAPFSAERTVDVEFTTAGPVTLDIITTSLTCGRTDTASTILNYSLSTTPVVDFTKDLPDPICNTDAITFTASPSGLLDYTWDFGDGNIVSSGTSNTISHTYPTPGTYYVELTGSSIGTSILSPIFIEDFNGGLPVTWTSYPIAGTDTWAWSPSGGGPSGPYAIAEINSTTMSNGYMMFDSDALCSGNQDAAIQTPAIDCSGESAVLLQFEQYYRKWYEETIVEVSTNGVLWDQYPVNSALALGGSGFTSNAELVSVDISGTAANQPIVYIRWRFYSPSGAHGGNEGCGYAWMIDDVAVGGANYCSGTEQKLDFVEIIDCTVSAPVAVANADVTSGCAPLTVNFTDGTTGGDPATSWLWNFDDGNFSTAQNPGNHVFTSPGTYNVSFEACNSGGCTTDYITITVSTSGVDVDDLADQTACDSYTLPTITGTGLSGSEAYYTGSGGTGTSYTAGASITNTQTLYIYDNNGGCTDEETVTITIISSPVITDPGDQTACDSYILPIIAGTGLSGLEGYYTSPGGSGSVAVGSTITSSTTIYIYDNVGICPDEVSFDITIYPTPDVDDIADPTACDSYLLPTITGTNLSGSEAYYTGTGGTGTSYSAGTSITSSQTLYIYDANGPCSDEETFTITINMTPSLNNPGNQTVCDSYLLPAITGTNLSGSEAYYTGTGGTGTSYSAGASITSTQTLYIYDTNGSCSDEVSFDVTVNTSPTFTVSGNNPTSCGGSDGSFVISGLSANTNYDVSYDDDGSPMGPTTMMSNGSGDITVSGLNSGTYDNITVSINGCSTTDATGVSLSNPGAPDITDIPNTTVCDSYTLPTITGTGLTGSEAYYTGPGGSGSTLAVGSSITSTTTFYIYDVNGSCSDEEVVTITINNTPSLNNPGNQTVCDSYLLPTITGTNLSGSEAYYTGTAGTGTSYAVGTSITSTQTLYIYDVNGSCSDEVSFVVTVNMTPSLNNPGNQTVCDSYLLPTITGTNLSGLEAYYTGTGGTGTSYAAGASITSTQTLYVYDANGSCSDEVSFDITVNTSPTFTVSGNDPSTCGASDGSVVISGLSNNTNYDVSYDDDGTPTGPTTMMSNGSGDITLSGLDAGTYDNIVVSINGCSTTDATGVTLTDPGAPDVDDLADQTVCDSYMLPTITGTNLSGSEAYYTGTGGTGTSYAAGASITTTQTLYIYDSNGSCSDEEMVTITVNMTPSLNNPGNQTVCDSYMLPTITGTNLSGSEAYYTGTGGTGTSYAAGASITSTQTLYIYDANGSCSDEISFDVTVNTSPTFTVSGNDPSTCGASDGSVVISGLANNTNYDVSYDDDGTPTGPTTMMSNGSGDITLSGLDAGTYDNIVVSINGCSTTDATGVTLTDPGAPDVDDLADQTVCDSYMLPTITGTNLSGSEAYYTGTGGTGTSYAAGASITTTQTLYIYDSNGSCSDEEMVTITINMTPSLNNPGNQTVCDSYLLPTITGTNLSGLEAYYTGTGGTGTSYAAGAAITSTQTLYVYDANGSCSDEVSFDVTVNMTPSLNNPGNQVGCDSYTLPAITGTNLSGSEAYYTGTGGTGTSYAAGASITSAQTLYIYDINGSCSDEVSFDITIEQSPDVANAGLDTTVCDTTDLIQLNANSPTNGTGMWSVVSGTGTFEDDMDPQTAVTEFSIGANEYMWMISTTSCGSSMDHVIITVEECGMGISIPSGFTPDGGDMINATWEIEGISNYPDCEVIIYNKWGSEVFSSVGYPEEWDGTYKGNPLPVGTYYYIINLNDGTEAYKGTVTIIK